MGVFDGQFKEFSTEGWTYYGNDTKTSIADFINMHPDAELYVGTDSQRHGNRKKKYKYWTFTTCVAAYTRRKGGNAILFSENVRNPQGFDGKLERPKKLSLLRQRLMVEAMKSLEVAWYLNTIVSEDRPITIHLDVNQNIQFDSTKYKDELVGYVTAQGFNCEHKPNAWAASWAADARC